MIISIEGNIGAGKTTLLKRLEAYDQFKIIYEPVEHWLSLKDQEGKSIFQHFYEDKEKYCFAFQMLALQSRFENIMKVVKEFSGNIIILERSIYTDYEIFAKLSRKYNYMSDIELQVYEKLHNFMCQMGNHIDFGKILYLKASPETCYERIKARNRIGEDNIDICYMNDLHEAHELWLKEKTNVINIDAEKELDIKDIVNIINQCTVSQ